MRYPLMKKSLFAFLSIVFVFSCCIYTPCASADSPSDKRRKADIVAEIDKYVIGPEDVLDIFVWKEESLTKTVPVRIDGKISLPLLDDIQAAGLTPLQLKEDITKRLTGFVDNPTVTVTVKEANSYRVFISGEVKQPGIVHIRSEITLVKLIIMAGGFTEWANKRNILIITKESGRTRRVTVNYNKIIDGDIPDIVIRPGDTVIVS